MKTTKSKKELINPPKVTRNPNHYFSSKATQEVIDAYKISIEKRKDWWVNWIKLITCSDNVSKSNGYHFTVKVDNATLVIDNWDSNDGRCTIREEGYSSKYSTKKWFKWDSPQDIEALESFIRDTYKDLNEYYDRKEREKDESDNLKANLSGIINKFIGLSDGFMIDISTYRLKDGITIRCEKEDRVRASIDINRYGVISKPTADFKDFVATLDDAYKFINWFTPYSDKLLEVAYALKEALPESYWKHKEELTDSIN